MLEELKQKLNQPLPGNFAHQKFSPPNRIVPDENELEILQPKIAAVLVLLFQFNDQLHTVLIERSEYPGVHSKQISFPGGKKEPHDLSLRETAIRECCEEIGSKPEQIEVFGSLSPLYIPPSNFLVHPFLGQYHQNPVFNPDPEEVSNIMITPIKSLYNPKNCRIEEINVRGKKYLCPAFVVQEKVIWGATAMILNEVLEIIKENWQVN